MEDGNTPALGPTHRLYRAVGSRVLAQDEWDAWNEEEKTAAVGSAWGWATLLPLGPNGQQLGRRLSSASQPRCVKYLVRLIGQTRSREAALGECRRLVDQLPSSSGGGAAKRRRGNGEEEEEAEAGAIDPIPPAKRIKTIRRDFKDTKEGRLGLEHFLDTADLPSREVYQYIHHKASITAMPRKIFHSSSLVALGVLFQEYCRYMVDRFADDQADQQSDGDSATTPQLEEESSPPPRHHPPATEQPNDEADLPPPAVQAGDSPGPSE